MVRVARVAAAAELLPLLSGQIRVTKVSVEGLDVLLETNAKGEPNWLLGGAPAATGSGGGGTLPVVREKALTAARSLIATA